MTRITLRRLTLILWLLPLFIDCLASVIVRESFHATLSAKAWHARAHRYWRWTHRAIDTVFRLFGQPNHCRDQYLRELVHGGVWRAWLADWRGTPLTTTAPRRERA